jgi:hypothetical protein
VRISRPFLLFCFFCAATVITSAQSWDLTGNSSIDPSVHFIGTTDNRPLKLRTSDLVRMILNESGALQLGYPVSQNGALLQVNGDVFLGGQLNLGNLAGDPVGPALLNGSLYYNTTSNKLRAFINGSWQNLASESSFSLPSYQIAYGSGSGVTSDAWLSWADPTTAGARALIISHTVAGQGVELHLGGSREYRIISGGAGYGLSEGYGIFDGNAGQYRYVITPNGEHLFGGYMLSQGSYIGQFNGGVLVNGQLNSTSVLVGGSNAVGQTMIADNNVAIRSGSGEWATLGATANDLATIIGSGVKANSGSDAFRDVVVSSYQGTGAWMKFDYNGRLSFNYRSGLSSGQALPNSSGEFASLSPSGLVLPAQSSDPSRPVLQNGLIYFNTTSNKLRTYANGSWSNVGTEGASSSPISLPQNQVVLGSGSGITSSAQLTWDPQNHSLRVGTGTTNPSVIIDGDENTYYPSIAFRSSGGATGYIVDYQWGGMYFQAYAGRYSFNNNSNHQAFLMDANSGQFGVNTTDFGSEKLHVNGDTKVEGTLLASQVESLPNQPLIFAANNNEAMRLLPTGQLAIGTVDPKDYKLAVAGNVIAEKLTIKNLNAWPDYVFAAIIDCLPWNRSGIIWISTTICLRSLLPKRYEIRA